MTDVDRPEGERFSLVYLEQGDPRQDSARMRRRFAALVENDEPDGLRTSIEARLGIDAPRGHISWRAFLRDAELKDVLDTVTLVFGALWDQDRQRRFTDASPRFIQAMNTIFREENLHYEVDARGGVHLSVDQEFERNRASIIAGLGRDRYVNVARNFEEAHARLNAVAPDGRGAVRAAFDTAEALFRLMFPRQPRLTADAARDNLLPLIQRMTHGNPPATAAAAKMLDALRDWIDACHNYRHEHGQPEVLEPPRWLAVLLVSSGAGFIRWLAEIDASSLAATRVSE